MKSKELESTEDHAELVSVGEFLVDSKAMEKMVDGELLKIANEELAPYKLYLLYSAKVFGPMLFGILAGLSGVIFLPEESIYNAISMGIFGVSAFISCSSCNLHEFFVIPLYKIIRARKIFSQAMEELHYEAMNNQIELKFLKQKFPLKVREIVDRKKKEEEDFQALLQCAKNNLS